MLNPLRNVMAVYLVIGINQLFVLVVPPVRKGFKFGLRF